MIFKRGRKNPESSAVDPQDAEADPASEPVVADDDEEHVDSSDVDPRAGGPWDASEIKVPSDDASYIDLGGLIVKGRVGFDLQIPADDDTDELAAVLFVTEDAAVEIRAFAATRSGGLWDEVRAEIVEEVARLEGAAEEVQGAFGAELQLQVPAETPDGQRAVQPSRIIGVEGPRWFLRGTFMGSAALNPRDDGVLESAFRDVVVVRGQDAMAPRDPLRIVLPDSAVVMGDDQSEDG